MTDLNNIKRIRWADAGSDKRLYGVTRPLRLNAEKETAELCVRAPIVPGGFWYNDVTPEAIKIVSELYSMKGITFIWLSTFGLRIEKTKIFSWEDYHSDITILLNNTLFDGTADVGEFGRPMPEQGVIKWSDRKNTVRWYGFTTSLYKNEKSEETLTIEGSLGELPRYEITDAARLIIGEIWKLRGVKRMWIGSFGLSVQIEPVFDWYDFHKFIIDLLNRELFDGKAFVEYKKMTD